MKKNIQKMIKKSNCGTMMDNYPTSIYFYTFTTTLNYTAATTTKPLFHQKNGYI